MNKNFIDVIPRILTKSMKNFYSLYSVNIVRGIIMMLISKQLI